MKVLILRPELSFLPEVDAYESALTQAGASVVVKPSKGNVDTTDDFDLVYRFGGFLRKIQSHAPEVHEYSSASTGHLPRPKNVAKSVFTVRPAGRVFTEAFVRRQFHFVRRAPSIFRGIGIDPAFLEARNTIEKDVDIAYVGSITGRTSVISVLIALAQKGFKIAAAGNANPEVARGLLNQGIDYVGRLKPSEVPQFISRATHGLNAMPTEYPFLQQTSSKVQEYLAAGLTVISNDYAWMRIHSRALNYEFVDLDSLLGGLSSPLTTTKPIDAELIKTLFWDHILAKSNFVEFLHECSLAQ